MTSPPDLGDLGQAAAYARELRMMARPLRLTGLAFAVFGLVLAVARAGWWPGMPAIIPIAALALGALNMIGAVAMRMVYHARRMEGD